jgi:Protein of unknown function VcgC/VcgE (DUF2780)
MIMMRTKFFLLTIGLICLAFVSHSQTQTTPNVNENELVKSLSTKMKIKPEQAAGGAGSIFNYAKGKLSAKDFAKVSSAVPGMDQLLSAAPKADTSSPTGALSQLGGAAGIASLAGPFKSLGMGPEMVGKMVPEVLNYVGIKGGDATKALLSNVLK